MHDITSIEVARRKAKTAEKKSEPIFWSTGEKAYARQRIPQYVDSNNTRYVPPHRHEDEKSNVEMQRIKEGK